MSTSKKKSFQLVFEISHLSYFHSDDSGLAFEIFKTFL